MAIGRLIQSLISRRHFHVISRTKTKIKPASPTPSNLKQYKLPLLDLINSPHYIPLILFYPKQQMDNTTTTTIPNYRALKESLSETLSKYYPFAGKLRYGDHHVDCNDQGVPFVEVRIGCKLSEVVDKVSDKDNCIDLFPPGGIWEEINEDSNPMAVQLNHFDCGGIAIALSLSHRLGDASTVASFISYWATLSRQYHCCDHDEKMLKNPCFIYELIDQSSNPDYVDVIPPYPSAPKKHWICKEMLFHNTDIAKLKAAVETEDTVEGVVDDQKYTRNELLTALLYRCAVRSTSTANNPKSVLTQMVNMRFMIDPPLPEKTVGNIVNLNFIPTSMESETKLNRLASQIKKGKMQLKGVKSLDAYGLLQAILAYKVNNHRSYFISSLCNYFVYEEMDFGWGNPIKARVVDTSIVDMFILMDTPNKDGIVVIASLEKEDMEKFQSDKELLTYASF